MAILARIRVDKGVKLLVGDFLQFGADAAAGRVFPYQIGCFHSDLRKFEFLMAWGSKNSNLEERGRFG
jgi:hypothetical protein